MTETINSVRGVFYIKLGEGGKWEVEAIREGTLRFGYGDTPREVAEIGDWAGLRNAVNWTDDVGALTRHVAQVKTFYEANEGDIFITFSRGFLWWCRPSGPIERMPDGSQR
jgi:hypothetical protein